MSDRAGPCLNATLQWQTGGRFWLNPAACWCALPRFFCFFFLASTSSVLSQVYAPVLLAMILKSISLRVRHEKVTQQLTSGTSSLVQHVSSYDAHALRGPGPTFRCRLSLLPLLLGTRVTMPVLHVVHRVQNQHQSQPCEHDRIATACVDVAHEDLKAKDVPRRSSLRCVLAGI